MPSTSPPPADVMTSERVRDPDAWLAFVAWAVVAFSSLQILLYSFGRDQGIYALVGAGILDGKAPYADLWDFKPPGIHLVYALAQWLLGRTMLAPRLLEVAGLLGMVFAFRALSFEWFLSRLPGLIAGAVTMLVHAQLEFWHTGQPEAFGGMVTVFALTLVVGERFPRQKPWTWATAGMLFGVAFLLKPPLGGGALVLAAYLFTRRRQRGASVLQALAPTLVMAASAILVLGACLLWLWWTGAVRATLWTFAEFTPGYTTLGWIGRSGPELFYDAFTDVFIRFSALLPLGVMAALLLQALHVREREALLLLLGLICVHAAGIAMQGKFFAYHYSATLPLVALIAGLGYYKLWRRMFVSGLSGMVAFVAFIVVVGSMRAGVQDLSQSFWWRSRVRMSYLLGIGEASTREFLDKELYSVADFDLDRARRAALELRRLTSKENAVYIWGFEPIVYWMAEREPASRFIYNVPQRADWGSDTAKVELMESLDKNRPQVVLVQRGDVFPAVTGNWSDSADALAAFPELDEWLRRELRWSTGVEGFDVYERPDARTRVQSK